MKNSRILIDRLRTRMAQGGINEKEFAIAIAEIVAATPEKIGDGDSLLLSHEIRSLKEGWLGSMRHNPC